MANNRAAIDTAALAWLQGTAGYNPAPQNLIRNSGFRFAQRQAPATVTTYSSTAGRAICADGWGVSNENASATYARGPLAAGGEPVPRSEWYGAFKKITSTGKLLASQALEGLDAKTLRSRVVRLQFRAAAFSGSPVLAFSLVQLASAGTEDTIPATFVSAWGANTVEPTLGTNLAYIAPIATNLDNCTVDSNHAEATLSSAAWARFGATFTVPTDCKNLIAVFWGDSQFADATGFAISDAILMEGAEIRQWSPLSYGAELARVQRYYCKTFNVDSKPGTTTTAPLYIAQPVAASTAFTGRYWSWEFPVTMRAAPTLALINPVTASSAQVYNTTSAADCTSSGISANGEKRCYINATTPGGSAVGDALSVHVTADAEL